MESKSRYKPPVVNLIALQNERSKQVHHFRLLTDIQIGIPQEPDDRGSKFEDKLIESYQDEDIDTDDEILMAGTRTCHQDLMPLMRRIEMPNYLLTIKNIKFQRQN